MDVEGGARPPIDAKIQDLILAMADPRYMRMKAECQKLGIGVAANTI